MLLAVTVALIGMALAIICQSARRLTRRMRLKTQGVPVLNAM